MYFQTPPSEMFKPIPATYVRVWWQCRNGHNLDINWTGAIYNLQVISVIISDDQSLRLCWQCNGKLSVALVSLIF